MNRVQNICIKFGNKRLSNVWEFKQAKLALASFDSISL